MFLLKTQRTNYKGHIILGISVLCLCISCTEFSAEEQAALDRGHEIYLAHCISCHGPNGDGMNGAYPSLIRPEIAAANTDRAMRLIREGSGFEEGMKPIALTEDELVEVVNYIQNSWGNKSEFIATLNRE